MSVQDIGSANDKLIILNKLKELGFKFQGDDADLNNRQSIPIIGRKIPWKLLNDVIIVVDTVRSHLSETYQSIPFVDNLVFCDTLQLRLNDDKSMYCMWAENIAGNFITMSKSKPMKLPIKVTKDHIVSLCVSVFGAHITHIKFPPTINYPAQWFICVLYLLSSTFPKESKNVTLIRKAQDVLFKMRRKELDGLGYTQMKKADLNDIVILPLLDQQQ